MKRSRNHHQQASESLPGDVTIKYCYRNATGTTQRRTSHNSLSPWKGRIVVSSFWVVLATILLFPVKAAASTSTSLEVSELLPHPNVQYAREQRQMKMKSNNKQEDGGGGGTKNGFNGDEEEVCKSIGECQQCTFSEQKTYEACKETGRWEKFECIISTESETSARSEMRSCKFTEADEEFAMVRFQMLCFLIGSLAVASVKRQKRLSASLFDQRKQGGGVDPRVGTPSKKRSNFVSQDDEMIEFTPMTNQQVEKVPLMQVVDEDLEVV